MRRDHHAPLLPTPYWTAAVVAATVNIVGAVALIVTPEDASKYVTTPNRPWWLRRSPPPSFVVWMATLEFSAGTLQRKATAEPDRVGVRARKLAFDLSVTPLAGVAVAAAAAGGFWNLAANHALPRFLS